MDIVCASTAADVTSAARPIVAVSITRPFNTASTSGSRRGRSPTPITPTWALLALPPAS